MIQTRGWLALEIAKARNILGVKPCWTLSEAVSRTMNWYRRLAELCEGELEEVEGKKI